MSIHFLFSSIYSEVNYANCTIPDIYNEMIFINIGEWNLAGNLLFSTLSNVKRKKFEPLFFL
ncbi:MAG: hypothetical protein ACFFCQ_08285, partial [Promethearchaeota archaeon]